MDTPRTLGQSLLDVITHQQRDVLEKVCQLIHAGADLTMQNKKGESALSLASKCGNYDVCVLLLDAGSDANSRNHAHDTALHHAVKRCDRRLCVLLLDKGANISAENLMKQTPSQLALTLGREDLAALLRERGAPLNARNGVPMEDNDGNKFADTPERGQVPTQQKEQESNEGKRGEASEGSHAAEKEGAVGVKPPTLDRLSEMDTPRSLGQSLLDVITHQQRDVLEKVSQLIHAGADLTVQNKKGESALSLAVKCGNYDVCVLLLDAGSDVNNRNQLHDTALHHAVKRCDRRLCVLLPDRGANIAAENLMKQTPTQLATALGRQDLAALLLERGAPLKARDDVPMEDSDGNKFADTPERSQVPIHQTEHESNEEEKEEASSEGPHAAEKEGAVEVQPQKRSADAAGLEDRAPQAKKKSVADESGAGAMHVEEEEGEVHVDAEDRYREAMAQAEFERGEKEKAYAHAKAVEEKLVVAEQNLAVRVDAEDRCRAAEAQANKAHERAEFEVGEKLRAFAHAAAERRLREAAEEKLAISQQNLEAVSRERDALNERIAELLERAARAETAAIEYKGMAVSAEAAVRVLEGRLKDSAHKVVPTETVVRPELAERDVDVHVNDGRPSEAALSSTQGLVSAEAVERPEDMHD